MSATEGRELLAAVGQFLRQDILPELEGFKAYNVRIAANALEIVARELSMAAEIAALDAEIAADLGFDSQAGPIDQQIAVALRDGKLTVEPNLLGYLRQRTVLALEVDNPKYSGLKQARALWEPDTPITG